MPEKRPLDLFQYSRGFFMSQPRWKGARRKVSV